jgi:thymidylate synthase (FAD)
MEQDDSEGLAGVLKHIERVGRVCYKSEDKITEDSYEKFVTSLQEKGHGAMLEHGTVYLYGCDAHPTGFELKDKLGNVSPNITHHEIELLIKNKWTKTNWDEKHNQFYITTNYRVLTDGFLVEFVEKVEPFFTYLSAKHEKRVSVKFTCDRGVSHEFVRNRGKYGNAFAQESTRYCNYNKGDGVVYCFPVWLEDRLLDDFENFCKQNEEQYNKVSFEWQWAPQQARGFLNHFLKTELIITAMMSDWEHFFSLRADSRAHPSAQELAYPLKEEFVKRGWI